MGSGGSGDVLTVVLTLYAPAWVWALGASVLAVNLGLLAARTLAAWRHWDEDFDPFEPRPRRG